MKNVAPVIVLCVASSLCVFSEALNVYVPNPFITSELFNVGIPCNVTDDVDDVTYWWRRTGHPNWAFEGQVLLINQVRPEHAGIYTCHVATTDISPPLVGEANTELVVRFTPRRDIYHPVRFAGDAGGSVDMRCVMRAFPESLDFMWSFNDVTVPNDGRRTISSAGMQSVLTINPIEAPDYGNYRCRAENEVGSNYYVISLEPPGPPGPPEHCALTNVTHITADIECYMGFDGGKPIEFKVLKSTPHTPHVEAETSVDWHPDGNTADIHVMGLVPLTNYSMAVFQQNQLGRSGSSWSLTVRTIDGIAPETPGSGLPPMTVIIIVSSVCGAILLAVVIISVIFVCKRKKYCYKEKEENDSTTAPGKVNATFDPSEDGSADNADTRKTSGLSRQPSWQSFRRKKKPKQAPFSFNGLNLSASELQPYGNYGNPRSVISGTPDVVPVGVSSFKEPPLEDAKQEPEIAGQGAQNQGYIPPGSDVSSRRSTGSVYATQSVTSNYSHGRYQPQFIEQPPGSAYSNMSVTGSNDPTYQQTESYVTGGYNASLEYADVVVSSGKGHIQGQTTGYDPAKNKTGSADIQLHDAPANLSHYNIGPEAGTEYSEIDISKSNDPSPPEPQANYQSQADEQAQADYEAVEFPVTQSQSGPAKKKKKKRRKSKRHRHETSLDNNNAYPETTVTDQQQQDPGTGSTVQQTQNLGDATPSQDQAGYGTQHTENLGYGTQHQEYPGYTTQQHENPGYESAEGSSKHDTSFYNLLSEKDLNIPPGACATDISAESDNQVQKLQKQRKGSSKISSFLTLDNTDTGAMKPVVMSEFPRERLYIRQRLGAGVFWDMWRAKAHGIRGEAGSKVVACKMLKDQSTPVEKWAIEQELELLKTLPPHQNILQLLGWCSFDGPLYLLHEFAHNGSLIQLLRGQRDESDLGMRDYIILGLHIASGMDFIATRGLIHRDLAARSVLVDDQMTCKLSDFGTQTDINEMRKYESQSKGCIPLRWLPPEALQGAINLSTKSNVFAFGVLLWEIITLGSTPWPGYTGDQVVEIVGGGSVMEQPAHCSQDLYQLLCSCWGGLPSARPAFSQLRTWLVQALNQPENNVPAESMHENMYEIMYDQQGEKI